MPKRIALLLFLLAGCAHKEGDLPPPTRPPPIEPPRAIAAPSPPIKLIVLDDGGTALVAMTWADYLKLAKHTSETIRWIKQMKAIEATKESICQKHY